MIIFRSLLGSRAWGLHTDNSDYDWQSIRVESKEEVFTLIDNSKHTFDHCGIVYNLRHWHKLISKGSPTSICMLFSPHLATDPAFAPIVDQRHDLVTPYLARKFLYWAREMEKKFAANKTSRPELVARHGYDTKQALNILRTLFIAQDIIQHHTIRLPLTHYAEELTLLRDGKIPQADALDTIQRYFTLLDKLCPDATVTPPAPVIPTIFTELVIRCHERVWTTS